MTNRRIISIALCVVSTVGIAVGLEETGRFPLLAHDWDTFTSAVGVSLFSSRSPWTVDGGPPSADAGALVHRQTAPLSSAQLGAPLVHGAFVSACSAPDSMKVVVKATVKLGRATDVTVKTDPPSSSVASCVERATRDLQWDISPKVDRVTVTY